MQVEIIVTSIEEALLAQKFGASRLELIDSFALGGLSPELSLTKEICSVVELPVNVMLRPHGNDFYYNKNNQNIIFNELDYLLSNTSLNAVVFGALLENNQLDFKLLERVLKFIDGQVKMTFHRAIDVCTDQINAFKELLNYSEQISHVLTSGSEDTALAGYKNIKEMVELSAGKIIVLAGSGVTPMNAKEIIKKTTVSEIHLGTGVRVDNQLNYDKFKQLLSEIDDFK